MAGKSVFALVLALATGSVHASVCPAGKIPKTSTLYCATSSCAAGDADTCCAADTTKCGGVTAVACDANMYWDSAKADTTITTPVSDTTKKSSCCTSKGTCAGYSSCPAGTKVKGTPGSIYCTTSSCTTAEASTCCEPDTTKCGGNVITCDANKYQDTNKAGTDIATPVTDATKKSSCCTAKQACTGQGSLCAAGQKLKGTPENFFCATDTCGSSDASTCCEADTAKCGGNVITCDANKYQDTNKAGTTITTPVSDTTKKSSCCTNQMTCDFEVPVAGGASKSETMLALTLAMFAVTALIS